MAAADGAQPPTLASKVAPGPQSVAMAPPAWQTMKPGEVVNGLGKRRPDLTPCTKARGGAQAKRPVELH
mgnify:CR=1 FL=1